MIMLIDNYDSFSYNLVQLLGEVKDTQEEIRVIRNDEMTAEEIMEQKPSHIILSPGPGRPADAGICEELVQKAGGKLPILGVCLGHQGICESFGAGITYAEELMHGKQSKIIINNNCSIFEGLPEEIEAARYHSLAADRASMPEVLEITAIDNAGEIMAVKHKKYDIFGLQFHPESIMTPQGGNILKNFLKLSADSGKDR